MIIPKILDKGILIRLVELFGNSTGLVPGKLKFEIAWVFTNMTMGNKEEVKRLVTQGVLDSLITLVKNFESKFNH